MIGYCLGFTKDDPGKTHCLSRQTSGVVSIKYRVPNGRTGEVLKRRPTGQSRREEGTRPKYLVQSSLVQSSVVHEPARLEGPLDSRTRAAKCFKSRVGTIPQRSVIIID